MRILRRHGIPSGLIVDVGCGNGILARQLGFAGYDVVGIDQSSSMISIAKQRAPKARFLCSPAQDAEIPVCDAVVSVGMSFSFAFAADASGRESELFFHRVSNALRPGGVLAFDFAVNGKKPGGMPPRGHWFGHGWSLEVCGEHDGDLVRRTVTAIHGSKRTVERHVLRVYRPEYLWGQLKSAGFTVSPLRGFGDLRFGSGHSGLLAVRR